MVSVSSSLVDLYNRDNHVFIETQCMESKIKNSRLPPLTLIVPILINNDNIAQIKPLNMHLKNEYYIQLKMPYTNTCILGVVMLSNYSNQYDIDICTRWKSNVQRWSPTTKDK